ncbi:unnamed protein product [Coregonus sp. 'balchen']|nr:unnamed protein product [Coregonus sp. 'balchen']
MALYSSSIKLLVYVILALHHLDGKDFRDNLMPPMGIWQWASMPHIELNTNTINFHQRPWTTQNTNETTGHSLHKCTGEACVMTTSDSTASRRTRRPRVAELRSRERAGASELVWKKTNTINFHQRPWTTQNTNETTGHSLHKCTGEACVMTTSDSTASRRTRRPRVAELRSRERAGASELVWKKTNTINFHQRPWTTQNTNETTGHSLHKCTGEACVMTTSDSTASLRTLRPRVAELRSRERAGASELVWKKMVEVINGAEERRIEAACCMFLALCCWLYGMGLLLTISVRGLLQIMVALELHGDEQKERGAERETDSCKDAQTAPVLVTPRGSTKKRARRLRRQSNKGKH